jgi:hypothetical protein
MPNNNQEKLNIGQLNDKSSMLLKILLWIIVIFEVFAAFDLLFLFHQSLTLFSLETLAYPLFLYGCYRTNKHSRRFLLSLSLLGFGLAAYRILVILIIIFTGNTAINLSHILFGVGAIILYLYLGKYFRNLSHKNFNH